MSSAKHACDSEMDIFGLTYIQDSYVNFMKGLHSFFFTKIYTNDM